MSNIFDTQATDTASLDAAVLLGAPLCCEQKCGGHKRSVQDGRRQKCLGRKKWLCRVGGVALD